MSFGRKCFSCVTMKKKKTNASFIEVVEGFEIQARQINLNHCSLQKLQLTNIHGP